MRKTGAASGETPSTGETPTTGETPAGETPEVPFEIKMIPTIQFDETDLTIPADQDVIITADNTDDGQSHNFAVYTSRDAADGGEEALAATEICVGPCTDTATLNLSAGEYFFRCDVHPTEMTGTLTVEGRLVY